MSRIMLVVLGLGSLLAYNVLSGGKPNSNSATPGTAIAAAPKALTDQDIQAALDRGRALDKKLADSNKPRPAGAVGDFVLVSKDEHAAARRGLLAIPDGHATHPEAQKVLASIDKRTAEGEEIARKAVEKARADNVSGRRSFAGSYEREMLRKGMSVTITTEGEKSSVLKVKFVLMSKALAFNMKENDKFTDQLRELGFRKLIMTDGYNASWSVNLN